MIFGQHLPNEVWKRVFRVAKRRRQKRSPISDFVLGSGTEGSSISRENQFLKNENLMNFAGI